MRNEEAEDLFNKADTLFRAKKFPEALEVLDTLDAAFPNKRHIMVPRARCLAELGRYGEALGLCEDILYEHNYEPIIKLKTRIRRRLSEESESHDSALDALDAFDEEDDELTGAFAQAPIVVNPQRGWGPLLALTVVVGAALAAVGFYFQLAGRDSTRDAAKVKTAGTDSATSGKAAPKSGGRSAIDHSGEPEMVTIERHSSQDGVTVNSSIQYGIWTDVGSYDAFLDKFSACEPAGIRMMAMASMIVEYRIVGVENGSCQLEMTFVEMSMFEEWKGKSMVCPCDNTEDFITVTEQLGLPSLMDGTLECEGALFDAMLVTVERFQQ